MSAAAAPEVQDLTRLERIGAHSHIRGLGDRVAPIVDSVAEGMPVFEKKPEG